MILTDLLKYALKEFIPKYHKTIESDNIEDEYDNEEETYADWLNVRYTDGSLSVGEDFTMVQREIILPIYIVAEDIDDLETSNLSVAFKITNSSMEDVFKVKTYYSNDLNQVTYHTITTNPINDNWVYITCGSNTRYSNLKDVSISSNKRYVDDKEYIKVYKKFKNVTISSNVELISVSDFADLIN